MRNVNMLFNLYQLKKITKEKSCNRLSHVQYVALHMNMDYAIILNIICYYLGCFPFWSNIGTQLKRKRTHIHLFHRRTFHRSSFFLFLRVSFHVHNAAGDIFHQSKGVFPRSGKIHPFQCLKNAYLLTLFVFHEKNSKP